MELDMPRIDIPVHELNCRPFDLWDKQWFLLASGDFDSKRFNSMTISWGSMGIMWNRPFVMVVVRPQRYTRQFIDEFDTFTLSAFPRQYHEVLNTLGTRSGRDIDKINASGLTPIASTQVASPSFVEAELIFECKKLYFDDFDPEHFLAPFIHASYKNDYHRIYFGQILATQATENYRKGPGV